MGIKLTVFGMALALLVTGCGGGDDDAGQAAEPAAEPSTAESEAPAENEEFTLPDGTIVVSARDPLYEAPTQLPAGPTSFTLKNDGNFAHQMLMVRLEEDDPLLTDTANKPPKEILEQVNLIGAIDKVKPGELSKDRIEVGLEPGRYGFMCLFKDTYSQETHAKFGMTWEFTVPE